MKIIVTGGAGFIGSHIAESLIKKGHQTFIIDNLSTGKIDNVDPQAVFYLHDITDRRVAGIFKMVKPEIVFHHAAQVGVQSSLRQPYHDAKINILGTLNLLDACVQSGVRKIIYASSAAAYGNPEYVGIDEKHRIEPISLYGISKHTPEHYLKVYKEIYGLDYTVLRYPNVFGVRQDYQGEGGVVAIFLNSLLKGSKPVIYGDGQQTRDFIYVKDVVEANLAAINRGSGAILNVGTGLQTSVNELFGIINKLLNTSIFPSYGHARPGDIRHTFFNITKAKQVLGWEPKYSLEDGVKETIANWN